MKKRIIAVLCALSALATTALPSVYAADSKPSGTSEVTITTEINGNGVITRYDGEKITTDSYTASALSEESNANAEEDKLDIVVQPDEGASISELPIYNTYMFKLIREFVILCMDEYYAEKDKVTSTPVPIASPATAATSVPEVTVPPSETTTPASE